MDSLKHIEVELKFPLLNHKELIEKLKSIATLEKEGDFQKDTYFNPAHRDFLSKKPVSEWLRLRQSKKGFNLDYKKWHNENNDAISCEEFETFLENTENLKNILNKLDFKGLIIVEKIRKNWTYKNAIISIDKVTELGDFIEIEIKENEFKDIEQAKEYLFNILKELNIDVGEQDFEGYPYLLLKKKLLI